MYVLPTFSHKTSTAEDARLKGSAFILPAAFADINIDKSWSVYYWLGIFPEPGCRHVGASLAFCGRRCSPVSTRRVGFTSIRPDDMVARDCTDPDRPPDPSGDVPILSVYQSRLCTHFRPRGHSNGRWSIYVRARPAWFLAGAPSPQCSQSLRQGGTLRARVCASIGYA